MTSPRKRVFDNKVVLFKTNIFSYLYSYIPSRCTQLRWSSIRIYYRIYLKIHENIFHRILHLNRRNDLERISILSITMAQNIEEFTSNVWNAFISYFAISFIFDTYARLKLDNLKLANSPFDFFEILLEMISAFGNIIFNLFTTMTLITLYFVSSYFFFKY